MLIRNVAILPGEGPFIPQGHVLIDGDTIAELGPGPGQSGPPVLDGQGRVAIPGLINTHTHLALTLYRGIADDVRLFSFLAETRKRWGNASYDEALRSCIAGCCAAVRSGTTTLVDSYTTTPGPAAEAGRRVGVRMTASPSARSLWFGDPAPDTFTEGLQEADRIAAEYSRDDLMYTPHLSAHSPYNCSAAQIRDVKAACRERGWIFSIHLAECPEEVDLVRRWVGQTPVAYLDGLGVLDEQTLLAHGVHLSEDDIRVLADRGSHIAHCPKSNAKLGNGAAPIPQCLRSGVSVALGTDSMVSNNNLDMLEEMRFGTLIHRALCRDPGATTSREFFEMATLGGARALGLGHRIGSLRPGKKADMVLLSLQPPGGLNEQSVLSEIVFHATVDSVHTVIVDGRVVVGEGRVRSIATEAVDV